MSAYAGLRNIILIGTLFGFHGLLNRSLLIDGVNEIFIEVDKNGVSSLTKVQVCSALFKKSGSLPF